MPSFEYLARYWLSPAQGSFWRWSDDGEVVCWEGGGTLVFRQELRKIVSALAADGLPPVNALFLLLGACRKDWRNPPGGIGQMAGHLLASTMDDRLRWLRQVFEHLDDVSTVVGGRMPTEHKVALVLAVFEDAARMSPEPSHEVNRLLSGSSTELFQLRENEVEPRDDWWPDLRWIRFGLETIDLDRLDELSRTGLDRLPVPAEEIESPEAASVRQLLASLENDEELAGLVRLTKRLMAAISLPRSISDPDELPVGGISDISNRGAFDRLLLSELASDADVLMTRVALNEALYLRRESPPQMPPESRLILVDGGIRMWGLPRVYATATALALAAHADAVTQVQILTARGTRVEPFTFRTREDLVTHMEWLATEAHPGNALAALQRELDESESAGVILVTSPDVLADPDFRRSLDEADFPECHVVAVSRSGDFELSVRRAGGSKVLTRLKLELESILEPTQTSDQQKRSRPMVREDLDPSLPALLSVHPFPFRLPHSLQPGKFWQVGTGDVGVLSISHDRRLTLWGTHGRGPELLYDGLPPGEVIWRASDMHGGYAEAMFRHGRRLHLLRVTFPDRECTVLELTSPLGHVDGLCAWQNRLFLIGRQQVAILDRVTGETDTLMRLPDGTVWLRDRFFRVGGRLQALALSGHTPVFEDVLPPGSHIDTRNVFDCPGAGGPIIVESNGNFVKPDGEVLLDGSLIPRIHNHAGALRFCETSPDGAVVSLQDMLSRHIVLVYVHLKRAVIQTHSHHTAAAPRLSDFVLEQSLLTQIRSFFVANEHLFFCTKSKHAWMLDRVRAFLTSAADTNVREQWSEQAARNAHFSPLKDVRAPAGVKWRLRVSESADGSRVWADSRGLIHLQSSDPDLPEISLAISADGKIGAWTSDGLRAGSSRLIDGLESSRPADVTRLTYLLRSFVERIHPNGTH